MFYLLSKRNVSRNFSKRKNSIENTLVATNTLMHTNAKNIEPSNIIFIYLNNMGIVELQTSIYCIVTLYSVNKLLLFSIANGAKGSGLNWPGHVVMDRVSIPFAIHI